MYKVMSLGKARAGFHNSEVKSVLVKLFNLAEAQAEQLLSTPVRIKQLTDLKAAKLLAKQLHEAGLAVKLMSAAKQTQSSTEPSTVTPKEPEPIDILNLALSNGFSKASNRKYRFQLLLLALATCVSPLIYLALVLAMPALLWLIWSWGPNVIQSSPISTFIWLFTFSFAPFIVFIFLLKPLFHRTAHIQPITLEPQQAPQLFEMLSALAKATNVPMPSTVTLLAEANASAAIIGSGKRKEFQLGIGLPLICSMNIDQLLGVIAHEFGHFTQGFGVKIYRFNARVNHWFYDRGHTEDAIQLWLDQERHVDTPIWERVLLFYIDLTYWTIKAIQGLFRVLLALNLQLSYRFSQQMEFDADRFEGQLLGSDAFASNSDLLTQLVYAQHKANAVNQQAWQDEKLFEAMFSATADVCSRFDQADLDFIAEQNRQAQSQAIRQWTTHPANHYRKAAIYELNYPPLFVCAKPATDLFVDFYSLDKALTLQLYDYYGIDQASRYVVPNHQVLDHHQQRSIDLKTLDRFLAGTQHCRLLRMQPDLDSGISALNWQESIDTLRRELPEMRKAIHFFESYFGRQALLQMASHHEQEHRPYDRSQFGLHPGETPRMALDALKQKMAIQGKLLYRYDALLGRRVQCCLLAMGHSDDALRASWLLGWLQAARDCNQEYYSLCDVELHMLHDYLGQRHQYPDAAPEALEHELRASAERTWRALASWHDAFKDLEHPYAEQEESIADLMSRRLKHLNPTDSRSIYYQARQTFDDFWNVYFHALSELFSLCEQVEQQQELNPLRIEMPVDKALQAANSQR